MRLSTSTNIYFNRPDGSKAAITDSIARCARAGYRVMDMNFHDCCTFRNEFVTEGYEAWLEEVARCARDWGVSFSQAHAPFYNFCDGGFDRREEMDELIRRSVRCAARLGIPSVICMPAGAPISKVEATKRLGAEVRLVKGAYDDAYDYACKLQEETGATFIHPFDDELVIAGQGTIGLEILDQLPDIFRRNQLIDGYLRKTVKILFFIVQVKGRIVMVKHDPQAVINQRNLILLPEAFQKLLLLHARELVNSRIIRKQRLAQNLFYISSVIQRLIHPSQRFCIRRLPFQVLYRRGNTS